MNMQSIHPIRLGVNIDHVATLRQARGTLYPSIVQAGLMAQGAGADGITVHLREDRRHIQDADIFALRDCLDIPLNLEMAVTDEMIDIARELKPPHCCLVPEKREELTTEGGLDVASQQDRIGAACDRLFDAGIRVSLFVDADDHQLMASKTCGARALEIHTGHYANLPPQQREAELHRYRQFAEDADGIGLEVHAGHGLTFDNVQPIAAIPQIAELNIGHFIVAQAIFDGLEATIVEMKRLMDESRQIAPSPNPDDY